MTMTTKRTKPKPSPTTDDQTLCDVDVTPGRAVFWQDEQREGLVHDVPKHIALQWAATGLATAVYEPTT